VFETQAALPTSPAVEQYIFRINGGTLSQPTALYGACVKVSDGLCKEEA
jgi:hypothetical protein